MSIVNSFETLVKRRRNVGGPRRATHTLKAMR